MQKPVLVFNDVLMNSVDMSFSFAFVHLLQKDSIIYQIDRHQHLTIFFTKNNPEQLHIFLCFQPDCTDFAIYESKVLAIKLANC